MLIQFNFKNFKSFRDEAILDLSAAKMTEFSDRVVSEGNEKILPMAAIYGANASGKSNIYNAFEYIAFCGAQRPQMRFRVAALRSKTATRLMQVISC